MIVEVKEEPKAVPLPTRPINPPVGTYFRDLAKNVNVVWDGKHWREPSSGRVA